MGEAVPEEGFGRMTREEAERALGGALTPVSEE
jgi:hypothetical protein